MSSARKRQRRVKKFADEMFDGSTTDDENDFCDLDSSIDDVTSEYVAADLNCSQLGEPILPEFQDLDFDEFDYVSSEDEVANELPRTPVANEVQSEETLRSELSSWATKTHLPRDPTNELLSILRKYGMDVPKDSRTLLKTPRNVDVLNKCGGSYYYLGIRNGISSWLDQNVEPVPFLKLSVNVDGVPLDKSTNSQLWPILGSINSSDYVFVIAIFHGYSKPDSVEEYLRDFIKEAG